MSLNTRILDKPAIVSILQRNTVGRLAFVRTNRLSIVPVNYVYADGWLYCRTSIGDKIRRIGSNAYNWWPAVFEVDEVDYLRESKTVGGWRCVIVHGGIEIVDADHDAREEAIRVIRTVDPAAFQADDPFPARTVIFRISATDASGREAVPDVGAHSSASRIAAAAALRAAPAPMAT